MNKLEVEKQIEREQGAGIVALLKAVPPFMDFEEGFGYQGVVLYDEKRDKVQCHLCGKWYATIMFTHLISKHDITLKEYKKLIGVHNSAPLCIPRLSEVRSANGKQAYKATMKHVEKDPVYKEKRLKQLKAMRKMSPNKESLSRAQFKNRFGVCDEQIKYRLASFFEAHGRPPRQLEVSYFGTLRNRFGTWNEALRHYGYTPVERRGWVKAQK